MRIYIQTQDDEVTLVRGERNIDGRPRRMHVTTANNKPAIARAVEDIVSHLRPPTPELPGLTLQDTSLPKGGK